MWPFYNGGVCSAQACMLCQSSPCGACPSLRGMPIIAGHAHHHHHHIMGTLSVPAASISCGAATARYTWLPYSYSSLLFSVYCICSAVVGLNPNNELIKVNLLCKHTPVHKVHRGHTTHAAGRPTQHMPAQKTGRFAESVLLSCEDHWLPRFCTQLSFVAVPASTRFLCVKLQRGVASTSCRLVSCRQDMPCLNRLGCQSLFAAHAPASWRLCQHGLSSPV
jgi:hypothetical protein